jgi:hydroxymethylpyrimidine/phosphomethylpyrimidine kinase
MKSSIANRRSSIPVALSVAGSDSGGGAGIQADLKTFAAFGVHGTCAITCLTAQNPSRVLAVESASARMLRRQIDAIFEEFPPAAVKAGMLFSAANIRILAGYFQTQNRLPLVVDPVMVATSGARLLEPAAIKVLKDRLLPLATLTMPNLDEAQILTGHKLASPEDLRAAAREIHRRFGCAALVKGGHLRGGREAIDIFFDGDTELMLSAPFVRNVSTHGTGCTYSAAVTAALALGHDLPRSVRMAKDYITQVIAGSYHVGKHSVLNHLFR